MLLGAVDAAGAVGAVASKLIAAAAGAVVHLHLYRVFDDACNESSNLFSYRVIRDDSISISLAAAAAAAVAQVAKKQLPIWPTTARCALYTFVCGQLRQLWQLRARSA